MNTLWIVLVVVALLVVWVVVSYNRLVSRRNEVDNAWSQIDVQLKRRLDLIPNLVETVKGYAAFEKSALEAVINARSMAMSAGPGPAAQGAADIGLTGALRQLFALSEAYPDLKANTNFLSLQEELQNTESRVAFARQFYNDAVERYNNATQSFPGLIFAKSFNFADREYLEVEAAAAIPPSVKF
ncbi:MAG: LemA family protein [Ilumatobacteraceae bacterium]|nr:LemA family protein [Ilumatobacteraceae bacterium]